MNIKFRKGQTVVEAIVAIMLLTTGFLGAVALLSRSFFLNRVVTDETKATYLASEGIEVVKSLIDHDIYQGIVGNGPGWVNPAPLPCCAAGTYRVDYQSIALTPYPFPQAAPTFLRFDPTVNAYNYVGSVTTGFNRWVVITYPNPGEVSVVSRVEWRTGPITSQNVILEDHFYNWHP